MEMRLLDFSEFLLAMGDEMLMELIRLQFGKRLPMGPDMHRLAMTRLREYLIVGGMPEAVEIYAKTRDFDEADRGKRRILQLLRRDLRSRAGRQKGRVSLILDAIPGELRRRGRKFRLSDIGEETRFRDCAEAFRLLEDCGLALISRRCAEPDAGSGLTPDGNALKCYMADTGLLVSHAFDAETIEKELLYRQLMIESLGFGEGMLMENLAAQMLHDAGHGLFFLSSYSKENSAERIDTDFLLSKRLPDGRYGVIPVVVKHGRNSAKSSLRKLRTKYGSLLAGEVILHEGDLKSEDGILYLPLYMAPLL